MTDPKALATRLRQGPITVKDLDAAAAYLDRLSAPEGVGLTRYATYGVVDDDGNPDTVVRADPEGDWVRHEDAAAVIAAKEEELQAVWTALEVKDVVFAENGTEMDKPSDVAAFIMRALLKAEAERDALKAALAPFGDIDGEGDEDFPDGTVAVVKFGRTTNYTVSLGDFRRARAALSPPASEGDEAQQ